MDNSNEQHTSFSIHHIDNLYPNPLLLNEIHLHQIGDYSINNKYTVPLHIQWCYEITFIVSGEGIILVNNKKYDVKSGDIILSNINDYHMIIPKSSIPLRFFYLGFMIDDAFVNKTPYKELINIFNNDKNQIHYSEQLIRPFTSALAEVCTSSKFYLYNLELFVKEILIETLRAFNEYTMPNYNVSPVSNTFHYTIIKETTNYIENNLHNLKNMQEIATQLHFSYSYLAHIFKLYMGMSMYEYYKYVRFRKAEKMLCENNYNITDIASNIGFQSIHSFSKAFKKYYNVSPTEYARLKKQRDHNLEIT